MRWNTSLVCLGLLILVLSVASAEAGPDEDRVTFTPPYTEGFVNGPDVNCAPTGAAPGCVKVGQIVLLTGDMFGLVTARPTIPGQEEPWMTTGAGVSEFHQLPDQARRLDYSFHFRLEDAASAGSARAWIVAGVSNGNDLGVVQATDVVSGSQLDGQKDITVNVSVVAEPCTPIQDEQLRMHGSVWAEAHGGTTGSEVSITARLVSIDVTWEYWTPDDGPTCTDDGQPCKKPKPNHARNRDCPPGHAN